MTGNTSTRRKVAVRGHAPRSGPKYPHLYPLGVLVLVIVVWQLLPATGIVRPIFLPTFTSVIAEFWRGVSEGWLWPHISATLYVWVVGYLLASVAGVTWGLLIGLSQRASYVFEPWLIATFVMPSIALVPIFILLFGIGANFKIFFVFLSGFFYVVINTLAGVRASEARYMAVARSFRAGRLQTMRTVIVPGSVPYIATGLRVAVGRSLVGAVAAEFVASNAGIGFMTTLAGQTFSTDRVIMGVLLLAVAGIGFTALVGKMEKHFDAWRT